MPFIGRKGKLELVGLVREEPAADQSAAVAEARQQAAAASDGVAEAEEPERGEAPVPMPGPVGPPVRTNNRKTPAAPRQAPTPQPEHKPVPDRHRGRRG